MILFDAEAHTYTRETGERLPSVTQVLRWLFPEKYEGVPEGTLKTAADWGNRMHSWIEAYCQDGTRKRQTPIMRVTTEQVGVLVDGYQIRIEKCEKIIDGGEYAGTYDMYGTVGEKSALIDIKCTADFDEKYLAWQLGMYKAAMEKNGMKVERCYCMHCPKGGQAKLIEVEPKSAEDVAWLMYRYVEEHTAG